MSDGVTHVVREGCVGVKTQGIQLTDRLVETEQFQFIGTELEQSLVNRLKF